jgi:hypothetical protein
MKASPSAPAKQIVGKGSAACGEYAFVFATALLFLYLIHFRDGVFIWSLSQNEGGVWFDEALRTLQGGVIYRDFFEFLTPGIVYFNALFLWILGATTTTVGINIVVVGAVCALLLHAVAVAVLSGVWRFVPAAVFVGLTYPSYSPGNHKWVTMILGLAGILVLIKSGPRWRSVGAGIAGGAAMLCTQDLGAGAAIGLGFAVLLLRWREPGFDLLRYVLCAGLTTGGVLLGFAAVAGFSAVAYDVAGFLFSRYGASHMFAYGFGDWSNYPLWLTAFGLVGLGFVYAIGGLVRGFWRTEPPALVIVALTGVGMLFFGNIAHPFEPTQFGAKTVPLTILGVCVLQRAATAAWTRAWLPAALALLGAVLAYEAAGRVTEGQFRIAPIPEVHRAGPMWALRNYEELRWLEANAAAGERVFLFPDKGGFYFLSQTRNSTSFSILLDIGHNSDAQVRLAASELVRVCPAVGIWHRARLASVAGRRPEWFTLAPLWQTIERNYDAMPEFSNGSIAMRRKGAGPACIGG